MFYLSKMKKMECYLDLQTTSAKAPYDKKLAKTKQKVNLLDRPDGKVLASIRKINYRSNNFTFNL